MILKIGRLPDVQGAFLAFGQEKQKKGLMDK